MENTEATKNYSAEDIVTYKNEQLLYFKTGNVIINAAIYLSNQSTKDIKEINLPNLGSKFTLKKKHYHSDSIQNQPVATLCYHDKYEEFTSPAPRGLKYLQIVKDYKMGPTDLFTVTNMFESNKDLIICEEDLADIVLKYIEEYLSKNCEKSEIGSCQRNLLPKLEFKTISQCKQIELKNNELYNGFPYWSFGNYWSSGEILIGYLFVHPHMGTVCLKDNAYTVGCVIVNSNGDLSDKLNKTVYVKKFCIFTEIFNPNTKYNLEYLYLDYADIQVVHTKRKLDFGKSNSRFNMEFIVLSKSYVSYTKCRGSHFWLEIEEINSCFLRESNKCFLCLPEKFIPDWPNLVISHVYTMSFSEDLLKISDIEYTRIKSNLPQYFVRKINNAVISGPIRKVPSEELPVLNAASVLKLFEQKSVVSFQAVLKYRKFNPPNSSRTNVQEIPPMFGTLGGKTHLLDFDVSPPKTLVLYLSNWEKMIMPIGFLPGVVVNVRNVITQKSYCKATALTTLDVVEYKPPSIFCTAKLGFKDDWGAPGYFGESEAIPNGVLVYGIINTFFVKSLSIERSCSSCSYISRIPGTSCIKCQNAMVFKCNMDVYVDDNMGPAKILIRELEMLKAFMWLDEDEWSLWKRTFEHAGSYVFERKAHAGVDQSISEEQLQYLNLTSYLIKLNEQRPFVNIGLKCRKLDNYKGASEQTPLWFGVEARNMYL